MNLENFSLENKVAIVTGASAGIGEAIAAALARAGADVAGVARRNCPGARERVEAEGRRFLEIKADLTSREPVEKIVNDTLKEFGKIDILVNNAGTIRRCDAIDFTEEDWDDVLNLNLKSMFFLSQKVAQQFIKQGKGGKIINIASMLSYQGGIRVVSYTSAKSGVMGMTRLLANEWAKYGINVNAIAPGYVATDNTQALREDEKRSQEILNRIPAGCWAQPEDMGGAAVFLASQASAYVQGYTLAVDGGWLAR